VVDPSQHITGDRYEHFVAVHAADEERDDQKVMDVAQTEKLPTRVKSTVEEKDIDQEIDDDYCRKDLDWEENQMNDSCRYLRLPAGNETAQWRCSYRTVSRMGCGGQLGNVLLPTQEGGGQAGEDKHGGHSNNVLQERDKWGNRRGEENRSGKSDVENRGELEVGHLWD